jgi:ribosomal protein L16 Arg81 hydroxylase
MSSPDRTVLEQWLSPTPVSSFLDSHLGKTPCARPGTAKGTAGLIEWATLDQVLAPDKGTAVDVLTVAAGQIVDARPPRSAGDVRALMRRGVSVVVRASERHHARLRQVADSLARDVEGEVHVQLYATPGGTNSFGWHFDFEEVFIVQVSGTKDYYFRQNKVARAARLGDRLDFALVRQETSPVQSARLIAGDWLYIPARWWHLVTCAEDALSVSIGVMPADVVRNASPRARFYP